MPLSDELIDLVSKATAKAVATAVEAKNAKHDGARRDWVDEYEAGRGRRAGTAFTAEQKSIGAARMIRAMAIAKGDFTIAQMFCKETYDDDIGDALQSAFSPEVHMKALAAGDLTSGGFMVPPDFASGIIELLRAKTVVRRAMPTMLPLTNGTLTLPRQSGGGTYSYVGENKAITPSQPTGDQITLTAKKLAGLIPVSNDLISYSGGDAVDQYIRNEIVAGMAVKEDSTFIRSDGTGGTPRGLRYQAASGNITATNGTSAANIEQDFKDLLNGLVTNDVAVMRPVWLMPPKLKTHLHTLRDASSGELIFPEIRDANPTIWSYPVMTTNNIPTNLGGGGNEAEVYLVEMSEVILAEQDTLEIAVSSEASYVDGNNTTSSFQSDQTAIRAITRHDLAVRHPQSIAVKTGVLWG